MLRSVSLVFVSSFVLGSGLTNQASASDMLALSLGVAPGTYSLSELAALKEAMESDNRPALRRLKSVAMPKDDGPFYLITFADEQKPAPHQQ